MIRFVKKREGKNVPFELNKIVVVLQKAAKATGKTDLEFVQGISLNIKKKIEKQFQESSIPSVEDIQDIVEKELIEKNYPKIAKAYILYRDLHKRIRSTSSMIMDIEQTMNGYLKKSDWRVNENSNVNYSLGGLILHNSGAIVANYWLNNIYPDSISKAHQNGDFHIHDLSMFSGYCAGWSLRQLIEEGFGGVKNKISSKPAKHLSTLISQMVNFLGVMQNEWAGAQAFSSFDTYLAPFVRADNLNYSELKQQIQSFIFSINTPSRWGSQAPCWGHRFC